MTRVNTRIGRVTLNIQNAQGYVSRMYLQFLHFLTMAQRSNCRNDRKPENWEDDPQVQGDNSASLAA